MSPGQKLRAVGGRKGRLRADVSEWEVVVAQSGCVLERATILAKRRGQVQGAVVQLDGAPDDRIAVVPARCAIVTQQVRVLDDESQARDARRVRQDIEHGKLGGVQEVNERGTGCHGRATRCGAGSGGHRFLATARLAAGGGIWNTSK